MNLEFKLVPETSTDGCGVEDITGVVVELQDQNAEAPIRQLCKREDKPERGNRAYQRQLRKMLAEKFRTQAGYRQIIDGFA